MEWHSLKKKKIITYLEDRGSLAIHDKFRAKSLAVHSIDKDVYLHNYAYIKARGNKVQDFSYLTC